MLGSPTVALAPPELRLGAGAAGLQDLGGPALYVYVYTYIYIYIYICIYREREI